MTYSSRLSALCDRIIEAGWLVAVVLVPLFFNIYSSRVFEPDKLSLLRSIALVMIAAWIVRLIEERSTIGRTQSGDAVNGNRSFFNGVDWRTPIVLPTLILVAVYILATLLSVTPRVSLLGSYQRLQGTYTTFSYIVIFLMIVQNMRQRRQVDRLVTAIVMTSLPIAFYGILQRVDRDPLPWGGIVSERVAANMGNAIFVAAYLIMAFFLTLGRVIEAFRVILTEEESRISDILRASAYIFVGAVQLIAFAFAGSRGPLLGWLPGMFIFGLVGLLMLRVSLQRASSAVSEPQDAESALVDSREQGQMRSLDVVKAVLMSITSLVGALLAFALALSAFPGRPQVELAAVAALIGGLVPLLAFAGVQRTAARWLWASWIFFSIIGIVGLFLVNFSDHPRVVELRESGAFGSLGTLFESEGGTGRVRALIWEGAVDLVRAHEPITFPDGTPDALNPLRPIIGYGPESMYVAYNRFYPPDLAHYEARNASPDRSHNETWDSFVITGGIGFLAEQFLFLSVFFFALKFIGWVPNRRAAITLIAMMILGGVAGAIGLGFVKGISFMGTGWPGGVMAGIVIYVVTFALFHFEVTPRVYALLAAVLILIVDAAIFGATFTSANRTLEMAAATAGSIAAFAILYFIGRRAFGETAGQPIAVSGHVFLIIALFGGILAHYLEISLAGIAIAATRTYFWTFAGLLVVTGLNWVPADAAESAPAAASIASAAATPPENLPRNRKKRRATVQAAARARPRRSISRTSPNWLGPTIALALVGALILVTLGFDFINTPPLERAAREGDTAASIAAEYQLDLARLLAYNGVTQTQNIALQPGQRVVIPPPQYATQLIVNSLTRLPYKDNAQSPGVLLMFFVTWVFGAVASLTELRRRNIITPDTQLGATGVYAGVSITVALIIWILQASHQISVAEQVLGINATPVASLADFMNRFIGAAEGMAGLLGLFYLAVFMLIVVVGLSLVGEARARALPIASEWGMITGAPVFIAALALLVVTNFSPIRADIVYKQGQPYINNNACDGATGNCDIAIAHLKQALQYAPDEDFYMLALGASFLNKSAAVGDGPTLLIDDSTYQSVLNLDADRTAQLDRRDALTAARVTLEHAQQVNPLNTDHAANLARLHRRWSDLAATADERKLRLEQSSDYYVQATGLSPHNAQLWNEWAIVYFSQYDLATQQNDTAAAQAALDQAQAKLEESLRLDQQFADTYFYLSNLYSVRGQVAEAEAALAKALELSPDNADAWARLTEQLLATNNYSEAESVTLAFVNRNPGFLPAWRMLARRIYFQQGLLPQAIEAAQRAVQIGTETPDSGFWEDNLALAELYRLSGDPAAALPYAQIALQLAPPERQADVQSVLDAVQFALEGSSQPPSPSP